MLTSFVDEPSASRLRNGTLVSRLRQLGHLRHSVFSLYRPHAARLAKVWEWRTGPKSLWRGVCALVESKRA